MAAALVNTPPQSATEEKVLLTWESQTRPFKRHSRDTYVTVVAIASLFGIILFIVQGILPVVLIASLVFLFYILSTVEPEKINCKITTSGVRINNSLTLWEDLYQFWFTERLGHQLLVFETSSLVGRLEIVIDENLKEKIKKIVEQYITHHESSPSLFDKTTKLASKLIKFTKPQA